MERQIESLINEVFSSISLCVKHPLVRPFVHQSLSTCLYPSFFPSINPIRPCASRSVVMQEVCLYSVENALVSVSPYMWSWSPSQPPLEESPAPHRTVMNCAASPWYTFTNMMSRKDSPRSSWNYFFNRPGCRLVISLVILHLVCSNTTKAAYFSPNYTEDELKEPLFKLSTVWTQLSLNLKLLEGRCHWGR